MNINYKRLFNLNISHNYFMDGFNRFVQLTPTVETETLMRNGNMLFKRLPRGITVLYRATDDEITPLVKMNSDQNFVFSLTADDISGLLNISNFDESVSRKYSSNKIIYFKNIPANATSNPNGPETINHEILDSLRAQLFSYSFKVAGNPATVKMRVDDTSGTPVSIGKETDGTPFPTTLTLDISSNQDFNQSVDLRKKKKGRYKISILNSGDNSLIQEEEFYSDDILASEKPLGITEIIYENATDHIYDDTEEYNLQFNRAASTWKYYIIQNKSNFDFDTDSLKITDGGSINGSPYVINQFPRGYAGIKIVADTAGTAGNSITLDYSGGADTALILSGETLTGGDTGVKAEGTITIINNAESGYTVSVEGTDFIEGTDFNKGATPADTANALISAINTEGAVNVTTELMGHDILINNQPSIVFRSSAQIPFFEKPKLDLQLQKVSDSQTLIQNLPNPAHNGIQKLFTGNPESEVYVFI